MSKFLEAARRYIQLDWYLFPLHLIRPDGNCGCGKPDCASPGKHPRIKWKDGCSRDEQQIEDWWGRRWPNAGIGIATGPSKLVAFDADGPQGVLTLASLAGGQKLITPRAKTARGWHVLTRGEAPTSSDPVTKLDVRSTGGYIVAAPSPHASGHVYSWEVAPWDVPLIDCPPALLAYARERKGRSRGTPGAPRRQVVSSDARPEGVGGQLILPSWLVPSSGQNTDTDGQLTARLGAALEAPDWQEVISALTHIPPDCSMDEWLRVGMALHQSTNGSKQALDMWDAWSRFSKGKGAGKGEYAGREAIEYKWSGFNAKREGGVGLGSLFDLAIRRGYKRATIREEVVPNTAAVLRPSGLRPAVQGQHETRPPSDTLAGAVPLEGKVNGVNHELPKIFTDRPIHWPDLGEKDKILKTCANAIAAVRALGIKCERDAFRVRNRVGGQAMNQWVGELTDDVVAVVRTIVRETFHFDPGTQATLDALVQECLAHTFHPIKDYFSTLQWDGTKRLETWPMRYLAASDHKFNRAIGSLSLVAAVRRIMQPGCKFDQITVLEGAEGRGKSSAIETLAGPENFSDQSILTLDDKGQQEAVQGAWLYEIADLAGLSKADVERVKAFASRTTDRARPAYGRFRVDQPRTCVFFATTNDKTYLKSQTGNRRFWPIECGEVDLRQLKHDRDQIWAETCLIERGEINLTLDRQLWGAAGQLQDSRMEIDPWEDILATECIKNSIESEDKSEWRIATATVIGFILGIPVERQGDNISKRVGHIMRRLGWSGPKPVWIKGGTYRGYTRDKTPQVG